MKKWFAALLAAVCLLMSGCSDTGRFVQDLKDSGLTGRDVAEHVLDGTKQLLHDAADPDNPLSGKNTDERVILCLEEAYPGHTFSVVEPFDKKVNKGRFCDENGLEFEVNSLVYDNIYHFACRDEYLKTILEQQDFVAKATEIAAVYQCSVDASIYGLWIEPLEGSVDEALFADYAQMASEILNCVDTPQLAHSKATKFSTGVVNYYTMSSMSVCAVYPVEYQNRTTAANFSFRDRDMPVEQMQQRFVDELNRLKEG